MHSEPEVRSTFRCLGAGLTAMAVMILLRDGILLKIRKILSDCGPNRQRGRQSGCQGGRRGDASEGGGGVGGRQGRGGRTLHARFRMRHPLARAFAKASRAKGSGTGSTFDANQAPRVPCRARQAGPKARRAASASRGRRLAGPGRPRNHAVPPPARLRGGAARRPARAPPSSRRHRRSRLSLSGLSTRLDALPRW